MVKHEFAVDALVETCAALSGDNVDRAAEIVRTKYPHRPPIEKRKSFAKNKQIEIFMRDGFIDRYSGERLLYPGVLCVLSATLPEVFPYQTNWKMTDCHQGWWNLFPSIDHIISLAFGGTNDDNNLVCTSMKRNLAKSTSSLDEIGWKLYPPGKLDDWDGLTAWFLHYVDAHPQLLTNRDISGWYETAKKFFDNKR